MGPRVGKITVLMLAAAASAGCGVLAERETTSVSGQEVAPVFVIDNGGVVRSTTTTVPTPPTTASSPPQTTPIMQINSDGSVTEVGTVVVTTIAPENLGVGLSALQVEVINWRTFQRKASASVHGETAEQSQCMVETSIRALPQELLPELTNPAIAKTQMSTVQLWLEELEAAKAVCF